MVIDSSVLVAILSGEDEAPVFAELISSSSYRLVSTLSFVETSIVIGQRYGKSGLAQLDLLIRENSIALVPLSVYRVYCGLRPIPIVVYGTLRG
jgi:ribonuclease VapC